MRHTQEMGSINFVPSFSDYVLPTRHCRRTGPLSYTDRDPCVLTKLTGLSDPILSLFILEEISSF